MILRDQEALKKSYLEIKNKYLSVFETYLFYIDVTQTTS